MTPMTPLINHSSSIHHSLTQREDRYTIAVTIPSLQVILAVGLRELNAQQTQTALSDSYPAHSGHNWGGNENTSDRMVKSITTKVRTKWCPMRTM